MSVPRTVRVPDAQGITKALVPVATIALFGVLPLFAVCVVVVDLLTGGGGWPLRDAFLGGSQAVLDGVSPYPALDDPALERGTAYVYPPLTALVLIPLTAVPTDAAVLLFALLLVAAVPATLLLVGVRDWRCYGLAFVWPPVLSALHVENITILIGLGAALVWRYRDRPAVTGASLGVAMAVKPLLWPLALWLAASRRLRAVTWSIVVAVLLLLLSWAVIGFRGLLDYPELLRRLGEVMDEWGYSVYALALDLGVAHGPAKALWLAVGLGLVLASLVVARSGDDRRAFVLAMAAVIATSPVVWLHYFALLLVVVAVAQPKLGWVWFLPLAMYASEELQNGTPLQTGVTLATFAATVAAALWVCPPAPEARGRVVPLAESSVRAAPPWPPPA